MTEGFVASPPVCWESRISCQLQLFHMYNCTHWFGKLPNHSPVLMVASTCAEIPELLSRSSIHGVAIKDGLVHGDSYCGSSFLLCLFYLKCGRISDVFKVFKDMQKRDCPLSWTAYSRACTNGHESHNKLGLSCLKKMHSEIGERLNFLDYLRAVFKFVGILRH